MTEDTEFPRCTGTLYHIIRGDEYKHKSGCIVEYEEIENWFKRCLADRPPARLPLVWRVWLKKWFRQFMEECNNES